MARMAMRDGERGSGQVAPGYWFRPKLFGFGATPATTAGWIATLAFTALLLADMRWVRPDWLRTAIAAILLVSFTVLAWVKTDGGWRWRSGWEKE